MSVREWLQNELLGNTLLRYAIALGIALGGMLLLKILKMSALPKLKVWAARSRSSFDDFILETFEKTLFPLFYYGALYVGARTLTLHPTVEKALYAAGAFLLMIFGVRFLSQIIRYALLEVWIKNQPQPEKLERHVKALFPIISVLLWGLGIVFLLDNFGFRISAIVAGLGIGGAAVALASQAVLADMFSYFAIMMDRPFELDDFIILGDFMGTVEHIGIKTTRLRSLGGEQLVFSNRDLTDSRVRNYKRMDLRRVLFKLGVTYDTPVEKLKKGVALVKQIIMNTRHTRFDRAHFASYGDFNLVIEVVYYVLSADYNTYMDVQQDINFAIKAAFEKEGIEFAFPTQTIQLASTASTPHVS